MPKKLLRVYLMPGVKLSIPTERGEIEIKGAYWEGEIFHFPTSMVINKASGWKKKVCSVCGGEIGYREVFLGIIRPVKHGPNFRYMRGSQIKEQTLKAHDPIICIKCVRKHFNGLDCFSDTLRGGRDMEIDPEKIDHVNFINLFEVWHRSGADY